VQMVFKRGRLVYDGGEVMMTEPQVDPDILAGVTDTVHMAPLTAERLILGDAPLIGLVPGQIVTENLGRAQGVDAAQDIVKMVVCERHHNTGHVACCYVKGAGLKRGALATSIAHDSHNIIACGVSDEDILLAIHRLRELRGGMTVAENGRILAELPLPVAGLMTDRPLPEVDDALEACKRAASALGANPGIDPFMTMSFLSLPVIPSLRLTSKGVFDVERMKLIR